MSGRVMGLDVGDVRIGVALSDPLGLTAQPHTSIDSEDGRSILAVIRIILEREVGKIVVGLPIELSGELGPQAQKVKLFSEQLQAALFRRAELKHIRVELWDERLTTAQAKRILEGSALKNKDRSSALDRVSAAIILQSYLLAAAE